VTRRRSRRVVWLGGVAFVVVAGATAAGAFLALREPATAPTAQVSSPAVPTLIADADLRAGPGTEFAVVQRLTLGTVLQLVGRSGDGRWLVAAPAGHEETVGWIAAAAVGGTGSVDRLAVIATGTATVAPANAPAPGAVSPTFTPDLADLAVQRVFSRDNRLGVTIVNRGVADVTARILVSVDGGAPQVVGVKAGEPLRAGDQVDFVFPREYVQRRATARVTVTTDPAIREEDLANNSLTAVVAPDLPNDLEIVTAGDAPGDGHLQVVLRNNSPIPVVGPVTVTAHASDGTDHVLGEQTIDVTLAPRETQTVEFASVTHVDFTKTTVLLQTDSITDAVPSNNVYPR
jgi:uncharacterized protein YraI